jgi:hypothetical protein
MATFIDYLTQGSRIFLTSWKRRFFKKKYSGDATQICQKIVKDCWNGRYFQTSRSNFPQFWTRDFGWCTQSLLSLGYNTEVHRTLRYALNRFRSFKKVTTTLTPKGKPFDFPIMAVDSLPWLIHSIKISKFSYYSYRKFLNKEIKKYFNLVINKQTGLVNPEMHFSSMKDFAIRKSSCYDNTMVGMLAKDLATMKNLDNPFKSFNYSDLIKRHFWNGSFFEDDLRKQSYLAGDANLFPFLLGIIEDKEMLALAVSKIQEEELDIPLPLKYTSSRKNIDFIKEEFFLKDYESDAVWLHMGPLFVKLVKQVDSKKAKEYKEQFTKLIEQHKNYPEVLNNKGKPFKTLFYYCDSGMLWAANYLTL